MELVMKKLGFYEWYDTRLIDPGTEVYVYNNYFDAMVASDCIRNPNGDWKYDDEWGQFGSILEVMEVETDWFLKKHYKIKYIHASDLDMCFEIFEQMKHRHQYSHSRYELIYPEDKKLHKEFMDSLDESDKLTLYYGNASYID
jgi:hypothetical protein